MTDDYLRSDEPELLPDRSADLTDLGWGDEPEESQESHERRLLDERPPHWE